MWGINSAGFSDQLIKVFCIYIENSLELSDLKIREDINLSIYSGYLKKKVIKSQRKSGYFCQKFDKAILVFGFRSFRANFRLMKVF